MEVRIVSYWALGKGLQECDSSWKLIKKLWSTPTNGKRKIIYIFKLFFIFFKPTKYHFTLKEHKALVWHHQAETFWQIWGRKRPCYQWNSIQLQDPENRPISGKALYCSFESSYLHVALMSVRRTDCYSLTLPFFTREEWIPQHFCSQKAFGLLSVDWVKPNLGRNKQYCCLGRAPTSAMPEFVLSCLSLNENSFSVQEVKGFFRSHSQKCLPDWERAPSGVMLISRGRLRGWKMTHFEVYLINFKCISWVYC